MRRHPRFECGIEVSMVSNGRFFRDKLVNISEGGAMLELTGPNAISRDVMIRANIGSFRERPVVALGDIKWMRARNGSKRVGIQFLYLPPEMRARVNCLGGSILPSR